MLTLIFQSFGCGIAFAFGCFFGASVITLSIPKERKKAYEEAKEHYRKVEERLGLQANAVVEIAKYLDKISKANE